MSLAELTVCCLIFMILLGVLMGTYVEGAKSFQLLTRRQGIQTELRRINALLRRDLTLSDFRLTAVQDGRGSNGEPRHALSMVGLNSWTERQNFDHVLRPRWNLHVLYYGSERPAEEVAGPQEEGLGQLFRKEYLEPADQDILVPLEGAAVQALVASPQAGDGYKLLTRNLQSFEASLEIVEESVRVHVVLRSERGATTAGRKRESELLECYIDIKPENTWPPR